MRSGIIRLLAMVLTCAVFTSMIIPVSAAQNDDVISPMASLYISSCYATISGGNGDIKVNFNITGTGKMTSIGATQVQIKNAYGTTVKTFYSSSTGGMIGYSRTMYSGSVTYYDAPSGSYYAVVYFKAANSSGSDTDSYTTGYASP